MSSILFFLLVLTSGTVLAETPNSLRLLVDFFNALYTGTSLDFYYDFGNQSNVLKGEGLVSIWAPMELKQSSYIASVDNYTKLVSIELQNKEHILVNTNTYNDMKLAGCQIRAEFVVVHTSGIEISPVTVEVEYCKMIYYTASTVVPDPKDVLPEISKAMLSKAADFLSFAFSGSPSLGHVGLEAQKQLFSALLFFS